MSFRPDRVPDRRHRPSVVTILEDVPPELVLTFFPGGCDELRPFALESAANTDIARGDQDFGVSASFLQEQDDELSIDGRLGITSYGVSESEDHTWQFGVYNLENTAETGRYIGDSMQLSVNGRLTGNPWYDEVSGGRGYFH